jgi:uncharacterized membrane-anchored protein
MRVGTWIEKVKVWTLGKTEKSYLVVGDMREKTAERLLGCMITSVSVVTVGVWILNVAVWTLGETVTPRLTAGAGIEKVATCAEGLIVAP